MNTPFAKSIVQLRGDSRELNTEPYRDNIDFVFVDACHEYEFVASDSEKGFEMLAPDGMIVWHDVSRGCPGVCKYLNKLAKKHEVFLVEGTQVAFARSKRGDFR